MVIFHYCNQYFSVLEHALQHEVHVEFDSISGDGDRDGGCLCSTASLFRQPATVSDDDNGPRSGKYSIRSRLGRKSYSRHQVDKGQRWIVGSRYLSIRKVRTSSPSLIGIAEAVALSSINILTHVKIFLRSPNVFDASTATQGEVTGMFMIDDEGEISTTDVNARFANGKPQAIESTYVMKSPADWDRFMRFMERYGEANGLGFTKA